MKLKANSRGFSSIVGAIFAVLTMFFLVSTVFVWSLSQNTLYNEAVKQGNQLDLDRLNEKVVASDVNYTVNGNIVSVEAKLENDGPLSAQIVTLWVLDTNTTKYGFNSSLNINLKPGNITYLLGSKAILVTLAGSSSSDIFRSWFISGRGNTISWEKSNLIINNYNNGTGEIPPYAFVSGGIGSISMDFSSFSHFDGVANTNGTSVGSPVYGYTCSGSIYTLLHVKVTNYDMYNRTLILKGGSMWAITPFSGTLKGDQWKIANVTGGKLITTSTYSQVINLRQAVDLYFGPEIASRSAGNIVPLFILLYGQAVFTNGTVIDYGQNLPFIALNVT
jgi:archaellum component FlaF (FlaF/FlaG flagellin family)